MVSSLNTNPGSYIALQDLIVMQKQLRQVQKRISTGHEVADAFDNGAVFGVAQLVRGDIAANAAASAELGNFIGAVQTANAGAISVSNTLSDIRGVLTHLSSSGLSATQFNQYVQHYTNLVASVNASIVGSAYNGTNLLSPNQNFNLLADGAGNSIVVSGSAAALMGTSTTTTTTAPSPVTAPTITALSTFLASSAITTIEAVSSNTTNLRLLGTTGWTLSLSNGLPSPGSNPHLNMAVDLTSAGAQTGLATAIGTATSLAALPTSITLNGTAYTVGGTYTEAAGGTITLTNGLEIIAFNASLPLAATPSIASLNAALSDRSTILHPTAVNGIYYTFANSGWVYTTTGQGGFDFTWSSFPYVQRAIAVGVGATVTPFVSGTYTLDTAYSNDIVGGMFKFINTAGRNPGSLIFSAPPATAAAAVASTTTDSVYATLTSIQSQLNLWNGWLSGGSASMASVSASVQSFISSDAAFDAIENSTSTVLNYIGALNRQISQQLNFNASIRNVLSVGLGSLVDTDLAQARAELTALHVKQELATQSLAIANHAPDILTLLFQS
ncbi:MAG: hypothetical protein QM537_04925 [Candidatus Symbiobacter sp.]|nr:hypothetical protein [Candidatus Symbiobacter sp.]